MKKYIILSSLLALCFATQAFCATYYVSPKGNDKNDGLSPKTPWASIDRVNKAKEIQPGDSVLWKRGGLWRGIVMSHSGEPGNPVYYGAYGSKKKARPTFYGSAEASQERDWVEVAPNIWGTRETKPEILGEVDGNFMGSWGKHQENGADVKMLVTEEDGRRKLTLDCQNGGTARNHIQLWGPTVDTEKFPESMILTLKVRANRELQLPGPAVSYNRSPWSRKVSVGEFEVSEEWKTVELVLRTNDTQLLEEGETSFVWHWSIGGIPADTQLEVVFESLKEAKIDRSLYLPVDIGNIIFDHGNFKKYHRCGMKKWTMDDLKAPGDYYYDAKSCRVFLYWDENPAKTCESIELAIRSTVIDQGGCHDVVYENLAVAYGAAHGFGGGSTKRITIRDCELYYIGGGHQFTRPDGKPVRFGNAIEFWNSAEDCLVEGCRIWEVYDAALTNQGNGGEKKDSIQRNITYRNNYITNSEYSFEYWNRNGLTENILFENNVCIDAGVCWSHSQRPDVNGGHLMFYQNSAPTKNFVVRGNKFLNSTEVCLRMENDWLDALTMENNEYAQWEGMNVIRWLGRNYFTVETFGEWQKVSGKEQESTCKTTEK